MQVTRGNLNTLFVAFNAAFRQGLGQAPSQYQRIATVESAIEALRPHTQGKLIIVLGAGGDRDAGKRPEMGAAAVRLADRVIVTDDTPRTEDPARIRAEIMAAAAGATEVAGRREAIRLAISEAAAGDIVLLAGKGHEQGQIVGDKVLPFDDVSVAREEAA